MQKNDKDWGKIIIRIALLLFIIFFISRWFADSRDETAPSETETAITATETGPSNTGTSLSDTESAPADMESTPADMESTPADTESTPADMESTTADTESAPFATETGDGDLQEEALSSYIEYRFRNRNLLDKHYDKHGIEMGFASAAEYEAAACAVANNPKALHKLEQEDGDDVYYVEDTGEFVVISTDGFIRTYYYADKAYFDRQ